MTDKQKILNDRYKNELHNFENKQKINEQILETFKEEKNKLSKKFAGAESDKLFSESKINKIFKEWQTSLLEYKEKNDMLLKNCNSFNQKTVELQKMHDDVNEKYNMLKVK
jgi:hypothetical protein